MSAEIPSIESARSPGESGTGRVCVFQSFRTENVPAWISTSMETVASWTRTRGYDYRFFGDEIFRCLPDWYLDACNGHKWPMSDLARLLTAKELLAEGYARVLWFDADLLVFNESKFDVDLRESFAFCREPWIGPLENPLKTTLRNPRHVFRLRKKAAWQGYYTLMNVNNALFQISDCWFLDSYIDSVLYTGRKMGEFRKQHMGTDLLTAFHGVLRFPLIRHVGAFSSFVVESIAGGNKRILDAYMALAGEPLYAANICFSEFGKRGQRHEKAVAMLLDSGGEAINRHLQLR